MGQYIFLIILCVAIYGYFRQYSQFPFSFYLLLTVAFLPNIRWEVMGSTVRFSQIVCLAAFFELVVEWIRKRRKICFDSFDLLIVLMIPFLFIGSLFNSQYPIASVKQSLLFLPFLAGYFVIRNYLITPEHFRVAYLFLCRIGTVWMTVSVYLFGLNLLGLDSGAVYLKYGSLMLKSSMIVANNFGTTSTILFFLILFPFLFKSERREIYLFDLLGLTASLACIILSFTRAAWMGFIFGAFVSVFLIKGVNWKRVWTLSIMIFVIIFVTFFGNAHVIDYHSKVTSFFSLFRQVLGSDLKMRVLKKEAIDSGNASLNSICWRIDISKKAIRDWARDPWLGRGTNSLMLSSQNQAEYHIPVCFLFILHDWGIFALFLHLLFLFSSFSGFILGLIKGRNLDYKNLLKGLIAVILISILMCQFASPIQLFVYWMFCAMFASGAFLFGKQRKREFIDANRF